MKKLNREFRFPNQKISSADMEKIKNADSFNKDNKNKIANFEIKLKKELELFKSKINNEIAKFEQENGKGIITNDLEAYFCSNGFSRTELCSHTYINPRANINVPNYANIKDDGCTVTFVNCGQGDCIILENKNHVAIIDFGVDNNTAMNNLNEVFSTFNQEIKNSYYIDTAIISHSDSDHIKGFSNLEGQFQFGKVILTNKTLERGKSGVYDDISNLLKFSKMYKSVELLNLGDCIINHNHNFYVGDMFFQLLGPTKKYSSANDNSICLKMTYKNTSYLFTGDMSSFAEKDMIEYCEKNNISLNCDVIKIAHHGDENATSLSLLEKVNPKYAIISVGKDNKYLLPNQELLNKLQVKGIDTLRTDQNGTIVAKTSSNGEFGILCQYEKDLKSIDNKLDNYILNSCISNQNNDINTSRECRNN